MRQIPQPYHNRNNNIDQESTVVAGSNSAEDRPITRTPDLDARFQATSPSTSRNATAYAICTLLVLKDIINPSKEALHDLYEFIGFSNRTFHGSSVSDEKKFFELESIVKSRSGRTPAEMPSERPAFQWGMARRSAFHLLHKSGLPKIKAVLSTEKGRALQKIF